MLDRLDMGHEVVEVRDNLICHPPPREQITTSTCTTDGYAASGVPICIGWIGV